MLKSIVLKFRNIIASYMPTFVNIAWLIFTHWKIKSFNNYQTGYIKEWVNNCCEAFDGGLVIIENFYFRKEELDQQSLNCVTRNKCLLKMRDWHTLIEQLL